MTDKDFAKLLVFKNVKGSALLPENDLAHEFLGQLKQSEIVAFKNVTPRDLKLHKCYFKLLAEVHDWMPQIFKDRVPQSTFYNWIKVFNKQYEITFTFKDGTEIIEVDSISFGRMNNNQFKDYVKLQIPVMYEVLMMGLEDDIANAAIETIEDSFERYFDKL